MRKISKLFLVALISFYLIPNTVFSQEYQITHDPAWAEHPSWSPDGKMIAFESFRGGTRNIWIIPEAGEPATQITTHSADDFQPCWSPDGGKILFWSDRSGNGDLWVYHFDGDSLSQLTINTAGDYYPKWSHDGSQIVFVSRRGGASSDIWIIPATGGFPSQVTNDSYENWAPTFSPDGTEIAYVSERGDNGNIWRIPVIGGTPVQVTTESGGAPCWSTDNVIAFDNNIDGNTDLFTINPDGTNLQQITTHSSYDFNCEWSRDGDKLCFTSTRSLTDDVWAIVVNQFKQVSIGDFANTGGGQSWVDFNDDGFDDFFEIENNIGHMYPNAGDGTFGTAISGTISSPGHGSGNCWADFTGDGYPDGFFAKYDDPTGYVNHLAINNGDETFTPVTEGDVVEDVELSISSSWIDYDLDGDLDIYIGQHSPYPATTGRNRLFQNNNGIFNKVTGTILDTEEAAAFGHMWADYDNDGDPDLFQTNGEGVNNRFYQNNGNGTFTNIIGTIIAADGANSRDACWGDYDNDGDFDLFVANIPNPGDGANFLYQNNGDGSFTSIDDTPLTANTRYSICANWADYDNDGDLDLAVGNGWWNVAQTNKYYQNNGDGTFLEITGGDFVTSNGACDNLISSDFDKDGDLDLFTGRWYNNEPNAFLVNNGNAYGYISIKCVGNGFNKSAIGAEIRIKATINEESVWQLRQITSETSQNSLNVHFGLGDASLIDSIKVEWSGGYITDILTDITPNQFITITETICGNVNEDQDVDILDIVYLINFKYKAGPPAIPEYAADVNSDENIDILDIVHLINYKYKGGTAPQC
ncbi:MAG: hypothetical protein GY865_15975 [candidate division Zixibacteria bacterium]|nr:hypothetical protein [candidate division Zixibacteria bacterium]